MIWSHEGDTKSVVPGGSEIDEPRRFEYDLEAEPSNVEVPAFDAFVRHDYRVQILEVHVGSSPRSLVGPTLRFGGGALRRPLQRVVGRP